MVVVWEEPESLKNSSFKEVHVYVHVDGGNIFSPCSLVIAENLLSTHITCSGSDKLDHIKSPPGFSDIYGHFLFPIVSQACSALSSVRSTLSMLD